MNYKVKSAPNNFEVIETKTEQTIRSFSLMKEAKDFMRHLNLGGGFDGWTPNFMVKPINLNNQSA